MTDVILNGLLRSTLALSAAAVLAWLLLRLLRPRSARLEQFVWLLVLLQAACWSPIGLPILEAERIVEATTPTPNEPTAMTFDAPPVELPFVAEEPAPSITPIANQAAVIPPSPPNSTWSWTPVFASAWFVVAVALLIRGLADYWLLHRRLRREAMAPPASWLAEWNGLRPNGVHLIATQSLGPMLVQRFGRAVVVMPRDFGDSLTSAERRAVFAHEVNHHRGFDPFLTLIAWLGTCVQWFNPFAWLASRRFHAASELACDARLDEEARLPLANVLLSLGRTPRQSALAMSGGTLACRIRALVDLQPRRESRWKSALLAALIVAVALGGWIRLEAKPGEVVRIEADVAEVFQPPKEEPPPKALESSKGIGQKPKRVLSMKKAGQAQEAPDAATPQAIRDGEEKLKQMELQFKELRALASKAVKQREQLLKEKAPDAAVKEVEKRIDEAQLAAQKKATELGQLKRRTEAMRADLHAEWKKIELLWSRGIRATAKENDDATLLEKTLAYLAAREPKFGALEVLPYEEHVETEAVLMLEALLKRSLQPNVGETQRQALERILQTPPTPNRKRMAEMRDVIRKTETPIALWEDRRDYWLDLVAELLQSVADKNHHEVWTRRVRIAAQPATQSQMWAALYCYHAAVRNSPGSRSPGPLEWPLVRVSHKPSGALLLRLLLQEETHCKGLLVDSSANTWSRMTASFANPVVGDQYGDARSWPVVVRRLYAVLESAKASPPYKAKGEEFRESLNQNMPGDGLDRLMALEGKKPAERARYFMERKISVNFQGRAFANAFAELRMKSAAPIAVFAPGWESNLRPITLSADAKWTDIVKEVCRQAELQLERGPDLVIVYRPQPDFDVTRIRRAGSMARRRSPTAMEANRQKTSSLHASDTPLKQAIEFLEVQAQVPITVIPDEQFDMDVGITVEVLNAPLAVVLESMTMGWLVWRPLEESIVFAIQTKADELDKNVAEFRESHKRIKALADGGDADAKRLLQKTFLDFSESPLVQCVQFLETQHGGGKAELRVKDAETPVTLAVTDVSLVEGLHLLAWTKDLKISVEGTKVVLADK
jgi:beta-lactamase regulating signal transducer with metallopeptidase domain